MESSENDKEKLILRWLNSELNEDELRSFEGSADFRAYQAIMDEAAGWQMPQMDLDVSYQKLQNANTGKKSETKTVFFNPNSWVTRIAASLLLVLSFYFIYDYASNATITVSTAVAEQKVVELPNGSKVTLNALSELSYNKNDWEKSRTVSLKGNAFFDVTPGKKFTVALEVGLVEVLGTSFEVVSNTQYLSVSCHEGKVQVAIRESKETHILEEGDAIAYSKKTGVELMDFEAGSGPSWDNGITKFKNAPFREVIRAIEAQFGVKITTDKKIDLDRKFTGGFVHSDINLALKMVCDPLNISYEKSGDQIILR